jgi:periplasmic divalent cation tolerance protein
MKNNYLIVFCSCPDEAVAAELAAALVEERLAACVTRLPGATSVYAWDGEVRTDPEVLLVIKTTGERLATLSARIEALHPYEVPEVLAVPVEGGSERYLAWLGQTVTDAG